MVARLPGMTRKDGWRVLAVCLVLGLGTIALYFRAFTFNFVDYDDLSPKIPISTMGWAPCSAGPLCPATETSGSR